jgi:D-galactose 1-dehydrogenase
MATKIGIIGIGKIAQDQHLPVIAGNKDFSLAAVVSQRGIHPDGVPVFGTAREMYAGVKDLDAVAICTPPSARYAIAAEALAAGKHVLLEKPPTPTVSEMHDIMLLGRKHKRVIFATWHSQYNAAVDEAKAFIAGRTVKSLVIEWKEDVRRWHPGQEWIWQPGGFGVFDPGINALSIVTRIMNEPLFVDSADLLVPSNRETPIAARLRFRTHSGKASELKADFDWRQTGDQTWTITIDFTDDRRLRLSKGGARLEIDGKLVKEAPSEEYEAIYARFAVLLRTGESDIDAAPLQLVADAFMVGRRIDVEPFA